MSYNYFHYNMFYYNNVCHVCKITNVSLKRCSACKTLCYCSKKHQKQDWKHHKDLCKAIVKSNTILKGTSVHSFEDFIQYNITRSLLWLSELSREMFKFESQMWMFPRVCAICFSTNVIIDCSVCLNASYCSELHRNMHADQHSKFCDALKLCMNIDLYNFHSKFIPSDITVCDFNPELTALPDNLQELMRMYDKDGIRKVNGSDEMIQFIIKSDLIGPIATVLYGMEKSGLLINRSLNKQNLSIHIVGADITEMGWLWKLITELPFHWIKNLKHLDFHLIGPELRDEGVTEKFADQLCDSCKTKHPLTKIMFHWNLYHEIVDTLDKPDIVVAFNSGLHELGNNMWDNSIESLTKYLEVPLLLTAYTEKEIFSDVNIVKLKSKFKVKDVLEPQRNPFSNMTPIRDWETENSPVFYVNGYIAIVEAKQEA